MFQNRATQNIPFNEESISNVIYNSEKTGTFLKISEIENTTSTSLCKDYSKKREGINYKSFGPDYNL